METKKKILGLLALGCLAMGVVVAVRANHPQATRTTESESKANKSKQNIANNGMAHPTLATPKAPSDPFKDLTPAEVQAFVSDVDRTFGVLMVAGINEEEINNNLSRLNERCEAGVRALVRILSKTPTHESEVRERISMVDYLVYRARWDEETRTEILRLATSEIPSSATPKIKGAMVVERSEIIGRIAAIDWNATSQALQSLELPAARRVAAAEAVFALAEKGMPIDEARKKVKEVVPEYVIASKNQAHKR